jgi:hypothetical protein
MKTEAARKDAVRNRRHYLAQAERSLEFYERRDAEIKIAEEHLARLQAARIVAASGVLRFASKAGRARRRAEKLGAYLVPSDNAVVDALERSQLAVAKDGHWKRERDEMRQVVRSSVDAELRTRGAKR